MRVSQFCARYDAPTQSHATHRNKPQNTKPKPPRNPDNRNNPPIPRPRPGATSRSPSPTTPHHSRTRRALAHPHEENASRPSCDLPGREHQTNTFQEISSPQPSV